MNPKSTHTKRVKHFQTKISKANIAIEAQFPKKLSKKLDKDEINQEILFTKNVEEIISDDKN